jgi:hypothetical protein
VRSGDKAVEVGNSRWLTITTAVEIASSERHFSILIARDEPSNMTIDRPDLNLSIAAGAIAIRHSQHPQILC